MNFLSLKNQPGVLDIEIIEYRQWGSGFYYSAKIDLQGGFILFAREYDGSDGRFYSFHCQDSNGQLKMRWDNAPHHPELSTFPHHRHSGKTVQECMPLTLIEAISQLSRFPDK